MSYHGKGRLPVKGIVTGVGVFLGISMLLNAMTALLMLNGRVGEENSFLAVNLIIMISALVGSALTAGLTGKNGASVLMTGGISWLILFCAGLLLFDGTVNKPWISLLIIVVTSGAVCATCMKKPKKKGYKKLRTR